MSWMAPAVSRKFLVATILNSCGSSRCSMSRTALRARSKATVRQGCVRPRTVTFMRWCSADFDFHPADFCFDVAVNGLLAQLAEVGVPGQPAEVAVAELQRLFQRERGAFELFDERGATGAEFGKQRA